MDEGIMIYKSRNCLCSSDIPTELPGVFWPDGVSIMSRLLRRR